MEAVENINVLAANADKRPYLMLTVVKIAFLKRAQLHTKMPSHLFAKWA
jgi:hypothetical protein